MRGWRGYQGQPGRNGAPGTDGQNGRDGDDGLKGDKGEPGGLTQSVADGRYVLRRYLTSISQASIKLTGMAGGLTGGKGSVKLAIDAVNTKIDAIPSGVDQAALNSKADKSATRKWHLNGNGGGRIVVSDGDNLYENVLLSGKSNTYLAFYNEVYGGQLALGAHLVEGNLCYEPKVYGGDVGSQSKISGGSLAYNATVMATTVTTTTASDVTSRIKNKMMI